MAGSPKRRRAAKPATEQERDAALAPLERGAERKSLLLRLSPELHAELRTWASQDLRSLNAHIEFLLREAVLRRRGR
ncbi:MAG: toxin-antitoxin system HicB family antitoxin [Planctomycetota bacterium]|nr:toxin-antitoxin system HicB family antitoxin [Planctomycetota bacterium]